MLNRFLLRAAVLIGGCAAATAIGLGISGPAAADNHPVRDLLGGVVDIVGDVLPPPAQAPPPAADDDETPPKTKPHRRDRPRPVRKAVEDLGDTADKTVRGTRDVVERVVSPILNPPEPVVDTADSDSEALPFEDLTGPTGLPDGALGPVAAAVAAAAPPTAHLCADNPHDVSPHPAGKHRGHHAATLARRAERLAASEAVELGPRPPAPPPPRWAVGAGGLDFPTQPPPPLHGLLAATWHLPSPPAGLIPDGDRDADGRDHQPSAPSG